MPFYQYPLPATAILPEVKDKIHPGQLTGSIMTAIATHYIGVDWVATASFLPGFFRNRDQTAGQNRSGAQ